jgi:hypothetical protein
MNGLRVERGKRPARASRILNESVFKIQFYHVHGTRRQRFDGLSMLIAITHDDQFQ